jgi:hypothetical protein
MSNIVKMIKNVFSEFEWDDWAKIACGNISSQALSACLAESQFRGVPPSKRCVSGQRFCSAAISSKSTGSATDVAATDPAVVMFGRDKKSATTFFKPGKYKICTLNSEMNAKWRCCLG